MCRYVTVAIAFVSLTFTQPPLELTQNLEPGWITQIWLRNIMLMTLVASALHVYFYRWNAQGRKLSFDPRPLMVNRRQFTRVCRCTRSSM